MGLGASAGRRCACGRGRPGRRLAREGCTSFFVDARAGRPVEHQRRRAADRGPGQSGLPGRRVYCHLLRHTFATNYLVSAWGTSCT